MDKRFKYRAWNKVNREMLNWDEQYATLEFEGGIPTSIILYEEGVLFQDEFDLMQYTGLQDKNEVEIYEGDIVRFKDGDLGLIEWLTDDGSNRAGYIGRCACRLWYRWDVFAPSMNEFRVFLEDVEVIGNIYEHPDYKNWR